MALIYRNAHRRSEGSLYRGQGDDRRRPEKRCLLPKEFQSTSMLFDQDQRKIMLMALSEG